MLRAPSGFPKLEHRPTRGYPIPATDACCCMLLQSKQPLVSAQQLQRVSTFTSENEGLIMLRLEPLKIRPHDRRRSRGTQGTTPAPLRRSVHSAQALPGMGEAKTVVHPESAASLVEMVIPNNNASRAHINAYLYENACILIHVNVFIYISIYI
jgi:hypothetical protein